jgi:hypothetical protein
VRVYKVTGLGPKIVRLSLIQKQAKMEDFSAVYRLSLMLLQVGVELKTHVIPRTGTQCLEAH